MKILVGVDGSAHANEALRQAALLSSTEDELILYFSPPKVRLRGREQDRQLIERARRAMAESVLTEAEAKLSTLDRPSVSRIIGTQPPRSGLLATAEAEQVDWIAVGARGLGPLERVLLGSVSTAIAHTAHKPVLVARPSRHEDDLFRVLFAYDGSTSAEAAASLVQRISWPPNTRGFVITVIESLLAGQVPDWLLDEARDADSEVMAQAWVREHEETKRQKHEELAAYQKTLPEAFQSTVPLVAEGHAAQCILSEIDTHGIDLVVLGARGMGAMGRLLVGSTSDKLLRHAACSVLIAREPSV